MPELLHTIFKKMELIFLARWIDVSKSKHQLKLFDGNRLIKAYSIAVGKILSPTPSGTYTIINKQLHPPARFGVLWMGLSKPHYGIHGQITQLQSVRMSRMDVFECLIMMF